LTKEALVQYLQQLAHPPCVLTEAWLDPFYQLQDALHQGIPWIDTRIARLNPSLAEFSISPRRERPTVTTEQNWRVILHHAEDAVRASHQGVTVSCASPEALWDQLVCWIQAEEARAFLLQCRQVMVERDAAGPAG
jgi:hypothetical protein